MESSRRDLFIDIVVDRFIFKNSQITLFPCSAFIPTTGDRLPKTGVGFYCELSREINVIRFRKDSLGALCLAPRLLRSWRRKVNHKKKLQPLKARVLRQASPKWSRPIEDESQLCSLLAPKSSSGNFTSISSILMGQPLQRAPRLLHVLRT